MFSPFLSVSKLVTNHNLAAATTVPEGHGQTGNASQIPATPPRKRMR
jgi:hypothetical protein